ncbi:hypothetical protein NP493_448g03047 [Ridgeia piscesae]|uniref:Uncharacterized protein n=1 Tax=Ridgeia piscesae TaxID=27915 RepID=A0AAD9KZR2_RIDPI|nr:hypothetical protein NP493_448g03047 [Ridgeia piscesae]
MAVVKCSTVYFCVGPVLVFVGVVLLCAFGFSVLLPHQATRSWLPASCTVANATFEPTQCSCSRHVADARWCAEKYPCLKVFVYHDVPGADNGSTPTALLFRSWGDAFYKNCSLHECAAEEWNLKLSRRFRASWGHTGQQFACYVNPYDVGTVILTRTSTPLAIHAIFWPMLCLCTGAAVWLGLCVGCWRIEVDQNEYRVHAYGVPTRETILLR